MISSAGSLRSVVVSACARFCFGFALASGTCEARGGAPGTEAIAATGTTGAGAASSAATGQGAVASASPPEADFVLRPGFAMEVVTSGPLVDDPLAFDWDARGRLWVIDAGVREEGAGRGPRQGPRTTIRVLEDRDRDGRYDSGKALQSGPEPATALLPWRGGVLVAASPAIYYVEDRDGDGRVDERQVLLSGFPEGRTGAGVASLAFGLDGWVYGTSEGGGRIRSVKVGSEVDIAEKDFRFRPETGEVEAIEGPSLMGRVRDDWGNWFGNDGTGWGWHYAWLNRYANRNPLMLIATPRSFIAVGPDAGRGRRISPSAPGQVMQGNRCRTARCPVPYRDDRFGPEFANAVFVAEPAMNLVHCEILEPHGASFAGRRESGQSGPEFLASKNVRFQPVRVACGPDGALYIADRNRPAANLADSASSRARSDAATVSADETSRGRILRVFRADAPPGPIPDLAAETDLQLTDEFRSANGWRRDTAQRLLIERRAKRVGSRLDEWVKAAPDHRTRVQALATLEQLRVLDEGVVVRAMSDISPRVREQALEAVERLLPNSRMRVRNWSDEFQARSVDSDPRVRWRLALLLGEWKTPEAARLLALMASESPIRTELRQAILTSLVPHGPEFMKAMEVVSTNSPARAEFLRMASAVGSVQASVARAGAEPGWTEKVDGRSVRNIDEASARARLVREWLPKVQQAMATADPVRGEDVFRRFCAVCHPLRGLGAATASGPDLGTTTDLDVERWVSSVLDPERVVVDRYKTRAVELADGGEISGLVAMQGPNGLTLQSADGTRRTVLTGSIKGVRRLDRSPMPAKFEKDLSPEDVAALLAYVGRR